MKKNLTFALIVLLILSWYVSFNTHFGIPKEFDAHMKQAKEYEEKEIYEDAIAEYEQAQACLKEKKIEIDLKIAEDFLAMHEENDYVSKMESILSSYEENEKAVIAFTDYYVENDKIPKAVQILREENKKNPAHKEIKSYLDELKGSYTTIYASYQYVSRIRDGYAVVKTEDGYGVIDSTGSALINAAYEKSGVFGTKIQYVPLCENGKWFYANEKEHKKLVPDVKYEFMDTFSEGRAVVCENGKYGYVDENLELQCEMGYENATPFYNDVAAVKKDGKWAIVNDEFHLVTDFKYEDVARDEFGLCSIGERIFVKADGKYQMINKEGKKVSDLTFDDAYPFMESGQPAAVKKGDKWGFVDEDGKVCIDYQYDNARSFTIEFAPVKQEDDWGYIDLNNKQVIPCTFSEATPFYQDGTASVKNEEQWSMIKLNIYQ